MSWYDDFMKGEEPRKPVEEDRIIEPVESIEPTVPSDQSDWYNEMMKIPPSKPPIEEPDTSWKGALMHQLESRMPPEATVETLKHFGVGAVAYIPSIVAGASQMAREYGIKGLSYLTEGPFPGEDYAFKKKLAAAESPIEYREIYESEMYKKARNELVLEQARKSPEKIRKLAEEASELMANWITGWMKEPETEEAKANLELANIVLEDVLLHYPHRADKWLTDQGFPNAGWLVGVAGELGMFKMLHSSAKEAKVVMKDHMKFMENLDLEIPREGVEGGWGAITGETVVKIKKTLDEYFAEIGIPKKVIATPESLQEYLKKTYGELKEEIPKGVTKSQKIKAHKIAREKGFTDVERRDLAEEITGVRSMMEMNKASAGEFIEALKKGKEAIKPIIEGKKPWEMPIDEWEKFAEGGKLHKATGKKIKGEEEAKTPIKMGELNKYSDQDIARFYLERRTYDDGTRTSDLTEIAYKEYFEDAAIEGKLAPKKVEKVEKVKKEEIKVEKELVEEKPPEIEIPDFKNTQEAYAFGERATPEQVKELQRLRKIQDVKFEELKKADNLQEALNVAVKGQLYDEALQKVKGTEQYKKFEEAKVKVEPEPEPEVPSETLKLSISDDIRIAQDMGLYAKIKEMIGKDKKVGEIMKEIKQGAYYKEDLADFGLTEKDIRDSIRAIKAEVGDESAIKQIQTMIEKEKKEVERISEVEEIESPAEVERVDPITGRPAGVKEELITAPREIDDIRARWMLEQMPIKSEEGKVLKSKVGAMTRMKELGQEGELVKNPKGEGWLVKKERKISAEERRAEEKEWEDILKEEELGDIGAEDLGERVDVDIDHLWGEKGVLTIEGKKPDLVQTSKEIREQIERFENQLVRYIKGEDNPTQKKIDFTRKTIKRLKDIQYPSIKKLKKLITDERGAITIHRKAVKELKDLVKKGYYTRNRIIKELRERGATNEDILKVFPDASVRILNEGKESKWWKPGQDSLALLPRRRLPNKMRAPAITRGEAHMIATMRDMPARLTAEHLSWENVIRTFEKLAPEMKETFYRSVKEGESLAFDLLHDVLKRSKKIRQSVSYSSHKRIGIHAIAMQPDGIAVLAQQGITKIPKLKPKELKAYEDLRTIYEEFFVAVNRARIAAGEKPFPPVKEYFTWIQDMTYLSKVEGIGLFSNWRTIESKMAEIKKVPGFRFAKLRAGPERSRKLNLNPFTVLDTYSKIATNYIEMAPRLAKLNELLTEKFGMAQNAPHAYNFIRHWLNYQAGKIPAWDIAHPTTRWAMRTLNNNIVYSLLAYNVRSALIQPAALASSYTMLGEYYMAVGLSHMMSPAKWKMAGKKSKVLNTRSPEVGVYEAMAEVKGIMKGVTKVGMFPLTALDSVAARVTWLGAYAKGMKKFKSEQRAINYADDIVTKTQASAARSDIAPIQRTQLGKTVTCLQTFVINHWGFLTKDVLGIKNADIKNPIINKRVIRFILATTAVNAFYEDVLKMNSPNPTPIRAFREKFEETEDYKEAFSAGVKEIAEYIPLVGGRLRYGTDLGGPVVAECLKLIEKGDIEALIKLMGVRGANQFFKMIRAHERGGTDIDIALGRYVEPREKDITAPMDKIKGLTAPIESP